MNRFILGMIMWLTVACKPVSQPLVEVVKFDTLENLITRDTDKVEVINFWATWCKPCIKELPYFQSIHNTMAEEVEVTLISLDFVDVLDEKVIPFVVNHEMSVRVLLLDEIDYNSWIDRVDPFWSGAIPATLIINHKTGRRKFVEHELSEGEIEQMIQDISS